MSNTMNMSSAIQNLGSKDLSRLYEKIQLHTDIDTLNARQSEENMGGLSIVSQSDAATLRISQSARTLYEKSAAGEVGENSETSATDTADTVSAGSTNNAYEGLSAVEREIKELEDYIASHPQNVTNNAWSRGSLLEMAMNAVDADDFALYKAERTYQESFSNAAAEFADFSMKITYGDYSNNDVSVSDLNFSAIDQMEELYNSYKEQIESDYEGEEKTAYLGKLDDAYNTAFAEYIIDPIKGAFDHKLTFFQPDDEETMRSIKVATSSQERLQTLISGYFANQSALKRQYTILSDGTKDFYSLAEDTSSWHDSAAIKNILTDSMNVYSSVKDVDVSSSAYLSAKSAADALAKQISDAYAENVEYRDEKLGLTENGEDTNWLTDYAADLSSGIVMLDFSKIENFSAIYESL